MPRYELGLDGSPVSGTNSATATTSVEVIAAQGSGNTIALTDVSIVNASTTDTYVSIKGGTTDIWHVSAPANGGAILSLDTPVVAGDNNAINIAPAAAVSTIYVSASGVVVKS